MNLNEDCLIILLFCIFCEFVKSTVNTETETQDLLVLKAHFQRQWGLYIDYIG